MSKARQRNLGQNFLVDKNILGVIGRAAALEPGDVVLEIGGGLGVLSSYLAARVAYLHVVEIDRQLEPALLEALEPFAETSALHLADAMTLELGALSPAPTKVVANLPYGIAAGVILRTIEELRAKGYDGQVTLVGAEARGPYDRPPLSKKVMTGELDDTSLRPDLDSLGIDLRLSQAATGLAPGVLGTDAGDRAARLRDAARAALLAALGEADLAP